MSRHSLPAETPSVLRHVWSDLPSDLQQRAVRLLTQLAYVQLRPQVLLPSQEVRYGHPTHQPEDSSRPS